MRLIGLLLLIAVVVVGFSLFILPPRSGPAQPVQTAPSQAQADALVAQAEAEAAAIIAQAQAEAAANAMPSQAEIDAVIAEAVAQYDRQIAARDAAAVAAAPQFQLMQEAQSEPQAEAVPPQEPQSPSGGCRVVLDGYLETSQVIGSPDAQFVHGVYWRQGEPEYNVLLEGSQFQRPAGAGGRFWAYGGGGCTAEFVRANIAGHIERTTSAGVNTGGWGDPSLFVPVG